MRISIQEVVSSKFYTMCPIKYIHSFGDVSSLSPSILGVIINDKFNYLYKINLTLLNDTYIINYTHMKNAPEPKTKALKDSGSLNPHPDRIKDELFLEDEFFDPHDRVQVKYEMLRRHRIDGKEITTVASTFGISRQSFYNVGKSFNQRGIPGLIGQQRGPKRAHKCSDKLLDFAEQWRADKSKDQSNEILAEEIRHRFGIHLNPRTIDRAIRQRKKKRKMERRAKL